MMILWKYFNSSIKQLMLVLALFTWAIVSSFIALTKEQKTLLVHVGKLNSSIVGVDTRIEAETSNFFRNFSGLFYTYNVSNYEKHMNRAVHFIDIEVMRKFKQRINAMFDRVSKDGLSQFATFHEITKMNETDYELKMKVERRSRKSETFDDYKIRMSIGEVERSLENPYGLIITKLEEIHEL